MVRKNMKKSIKLLVFVSMLLVLVMSVALISCGGNGDANTDSNQNLKNKCTVTFVQADGTEEKVTVDIGKTATAPELKQIEGYTVAWDVTDLTYLSEDITVTAIKTPIEYGIKYELDGGTNDDGNVSTFTIESSTVVLNNPSKTGYNFLGWYSDAEFKTKVEEIPEGSIGDIKLYANWETVAYNITYILNGGENNPDNPATYNVTFDDIILKGASRAGYDFVGWYSDQYFSTPCEKIPASSTGNITLYAKFEIENFDINYQLDGGRNNKNNPTQYNEETTVVFGKPSKYGYRFLGWYSNEEYTEEITGINFGSKGDMTIYAKWEVITTEVTYVLNNLAEVNPENPSSYTVETVQQLSAPLNVKNGYTFEGWYTDSYFTQKIETIEKMFGYSKIYAKITANQYSISYDTKNGSRPEGNPSSYTVENVGENKLVLDDSVRSGYKFLGWYLDDKYTGEPITEVPALTLADIMLYAKWEIVTYNITYVLYDGINAESNKTTYTVENNAKFAPATKEGTYLVGWFTDEAFTNEVISTNGLAEDLTLYAKWFDKYSDPMKKIESSNIESVIANESNYRKEHGVDLFDGIRDVPDIGWSNDPETKIDIEGSYWSGKLGDKLTIIFKEEISIYRMDAFVTGNWTLSEFVCFDAEGFEVTKGELRAEAANHKVTGFINLEEPVKVKKIEITITELKWTNHSCEGAKTHKIGELEIYAVNPDYIAPPAEDII